MGIASGGRWAYFAARSNTFAWMAWILLFSAALHAASSFCPNHNRFPATTDNAPRSMFASRSSSDSSSATTTTTDTVFTNGRLVEFTTGNGKTKPATLGAVIGPDGKRNLRILTSSGRTASVPPKNIRHIVPNVESMIATEDQIAEHERAAAEALESDSTSNGRSVVDVWEMLLEDGAETVDLPTLADLIVGDDSSLSCYAARTILQEGAASFCFKEAKRKPSDRSCEYEPRPAGVVEILRAQAQAEAEERAKWAELKQRIDDACNDDNTEFDADSEAEETRSALKSLERLGCLANLGREEADAEEKKPSNSEAIAASREFLKKIGRRATPEAARSVLVGIGVWDVHTNLDLVRLNVPTSFSADLEDLAAQIAANPPPDLDEASRLDLTHLPAFAIDEASTKEIDDALSVELLSEDSEGGPMHARQRWWVHIADPSRYIEPGSPLDGEARRRLSTLYLPTGTIPMFPLGLAAGALSLVPGEISCALSVGLVLDADGCIDEATPPIITPSLVNTTRLTYEQVDKLLDPFAMASGSGITEEDFGGIGDVGAALDCLRRLEWASRERLRWRIDGGSLESIGPYELPDMSIKAQPSPGEPDGWAVDVVARERFAASRIVTELALAANEAIALYGKTHGLPMPFRCQELEGVSDEDIERTPEGPCRSWLAIRSTVRSQVTPDPTRPHAGLGLDLYVQATSPIRRYADLALHHQIKAHLRGGDGGPPFDADTLVRLAQDQGALNRRLERPARDYWLKEFLRRRGNKQSTNALVLSGDRYKDDLYKLFLPELGAIVSYKSSELLEIGDEISVPSGLLARSV